MFRLSTLNDQLSTPQFHQSPTTSHQSLHFYHFSKSISSPSSVSRFRKNAMMMPSPTAASAAASVMIKMANACPSAEPTSRENATRLMFTAFNMSSTDIKMMITFRRVTTPITPIVNSTMPSHKYWLIGIIAAPASSYFLLGHHHRADHGHQQQDRRDFKREHILAEQNFSHELRARFESACRGRLPQYQMGPANGNRNREFRAHRQRQKQSKPPLPVELDLVQRNIHVDQHN